jgi:hypothetical protein
MAGMPSLSITRQVKICAMTGRSGERAASPGAFPQRLLVIDEFGTFAGMAARMHKRARGTGPSPALDQRRQIEWQGRQAGHRLVLAVHQPNLRLFGDSDSRGQYGYRLITGAYTASLWRMTFGYAPRIEWDARIKGRGVVGVGEAENLIHAAQLTWMPAAERRYALTGPPPPDWFTGMRPAPWINARVISEGRKLAGVSLVDVPLVGVPPGPDIHVPAQTRRTVPPAVPPPDHPVWPLAGPGPARRAGRHRAPQTGGEPARSTGTVARHAAGGDIGPGRRGGHRGDRGRRPLSRLRQNRQLPPHPHPPPHPRRDQDRQRPALLDP